MVFPIGDDNTDRASFPVVTIVFIAINVLVFVLLQGGGTNDKFTYALSCVPAEIASGRDIVTEDHPVRVDTPAGPREVMAPGLKPTPIPVYLTLLTSIFMHGGWAHLLGNMWFLWIFGDNIEDDMGKPRYIVFYLLTGLLASLAHVLLNLASQIPSLGASGAISGVMGGVLVAAPAPPRDGTTDARCHSGSRHRGRRHLVPVSTDQRPGHARRRANAASPTAPTSAASSPARPWPSPS